MSLGLSSYPYPTLLSAKMKSFTLEFAGNKVRFDTPDQDPAPPLTDGMNRISSFSLAYAALIYINKNTKQVDGSDLVNLDWIKQYDLEVEFYVQIQLLLSSDLRIRNRVVSVALKDLHVEDTCPMFTEQRAAAQIVEIIRKARETFETADFLMGRSMVVQFETQYEITPWRDSQNEQN